MYVPLPDRDARAALVARTLAGVASALSAADYAALAERCAGYSGRDLTAVCREAAMAPLRELWAGRLLQGAGALPCARHMRMRRALFFHDSFYLAGAVYC